MPLPLIPFLIGGASILTGLIGVTGVSVEKDRIKDAEKRINRAKSKYEDKKKSLEQTQQLAKNVLEDLDKTRHDIQASFSRFSDAFQKILNRPQQREVGRERFKFSSVDLRNIRQVSMLSGGAIAAGVLGMVGGACIAGGGLFAGPAILFSALHLSGKADEAQSQADKAEREVSSAVGKMDKIITFFETIRPLADALLYELRKANYLYETKVSQLEELVNRCNNYLLFSEEDKLLLDNNIMLVKVLANMTRADLLRKDSKGEPIMEVEAIRAHEVYNLIDKSESSLNEIAA